MLHMRKTPLPYGKRGFHYSLVIAA